MQNDPSYGPLRILRPGGDSVPSARAASPPPLLSPLYKTGRTQASAAADVSVCVVVVAVVLLFYIVCVVVDACAAAIAAVKRLKKMLCSNKYICRLCTRRPSVVVYLNQAQIQHNLTILVLPPAKARPDLAINDGTTFLETAGTLSEYHSKTWQMLSGVLAVHLVGGADVISHATHGFLGVCMYVPYDEGGDCEKHI